VVAKTGDGNDTISEFQTRIKSKNKNKEDYSQSTSRTLSIISLHFALI